MGKATIVSHIGGGEYNVVLDLDSVRITAKIAAITERITTLTDELIPAAQEKIDELENELQTAADGQDEIIEQTADGTAGDPPVGITTAGVIAAHNAQRAIAALGSLSENSALMEAAASHANWMAANDTASHTGANGTRANDRIVAAGYDPEWTGENIAAGQKSITDAMDGWMASATHRANILRPEFTEIGFAIVFDPTTFYGTYWCVTFGKPA